MMYDLMYKKLQTDVAILLYLTYAQHSIYSLLYIFSLSLSFALLSTCSGVSDQRYGGSRLEAEVAELEESHTGTGQSLRV